jgi:hypothetical protein
VLKATLPLRFSHFLPLLIAISILDSTMLLIYMLSKDIEVEELILRSGYPEGSTATLLFVNSVSNVFLETFLRLRTVPSTFPCNRIEFFNRIDQSIVLERFVVELCIVIVVDDLFSQAFEIRLESFVQISFVLWSHLVDEFPIHFIVVDCLIIRSRWKRSFDPNNTRLPEMKSDFIRNTCAVVTLVCVVCFVHWICWMRRLLGVAMNTIDRVDKGWDILGFVIAPFLGPNNL